MKGFRERAISEWEKVRIDFIMEVERLFFELFGEHPTKVEFVCINEAKIIKDELLFHYNWRENKFFLILKKDDSGSCYIEEVNSIADIGCMIEMVNEENKTKLTHATHMIQCKWYK